MASDTQSERDPIAALYLAKIAAWKAALDSYNAAKALEGEQPLSGGMPGNPLRGVSDLPVGIFRDKSLTEAIPIYLEAGRRKQTNKEIAQGLQAGGFPTMSGNFEATVGTALFRLKEAGIVLRFPDGWDVASSYPESLRSRLEKEAKPRKIKKAKGKAAKKPATEKAQSAEPTRPIKIKVVKTTPTPVEVAS